MASSRVHLLWLRSVAFVRHLPAHSLTLLRSLCTRRGLLILAGALVCLNAVAVLVHVQSTPDLGLRSAFSTALKAPPREFRPDAGNPMPEAGDRVVRLGAGGPEKQIDVDTWPELLTAPRTLRDRLADVPPDKLADWGAKLVRENGEDVLLVRAKLERYVGGSKLPIRGWCRLGKLPLEEMVPSVLWFFLKLTLFLVGALVLWKRPADNAAAQFFLLCVVTLGAYMGGYHWTYIASRPPLLLVFMVCGVLLPV